MSDPGLWFRRMALGDVERVMRVEHEVYEFPWTEKIFSDCIRVGYYCWLALQRQNIVGHAVISVSAGESHMLNLSIAREYQRRGFGKEFIEFLIQQAQAKQAQTMLLEVRPSNTAAINCYNSAGFNEIGLRKDYYPAPEGREDALLFARHIVTTSHTLNS
jgi:ribosomal-protein-alanine N-acetyltransferase